MSALPLELLVGKKSVKKEHLAVHSRVEAAESRRQAIMEKVERRRKWHWTVLLTSFVSATLRSVAWVIGLANSHRRRRLKLGPDYFSL